MITERHLTILRRYLRLVMDSAGKDRKLVITADSFVFIESGQSVTQEEAKDVAEFLYIITEAYDEP